MAKNRFKTSLDIWKKTVKTFKENPIIFVPFIIVGVFEGIALSLIYLVPRWPLSVVLAPPIRTFFGERFLHYPLNLILIPKLFNYAHIACSLIIGVLMTGMVISMLNDARQGLKPAILPNLVRAIKRYLGLAAIWLVAFVIMMFLFKGPSRLLHLKQPLQMQILFYVTFLIGIFIQIAFIYAMPAVVIENKKFFAAIKRGMSIFKQNFLPSLVLVGLPSLLFIPLMILKSRAPLFMGKFFPEIVLFILGLGVVVTVLIDCLITCSTTVLFLGQKESQ